MKSLIPTLVALTLSAASLSAGAAVPTQLLGEPAQAAAAKRTIVIDANTRWVNVQHGEVVKFVSNGEEFAWAFDGIPTSFDLKQIAPSGALARNVRVQITLDPSEMN